MRSSHCTSCSVSQPASSAICLIIGVQALGGLGHGLWAQLAIVAATICYAGAAIFGKNFRGLDPMLPAGGSLIAGSAIMIPSPLWRSIIPGRWPHRQARCWR